MQYIGNGWDDLLMREFSAPYFLELMQKVDQEYAGYNVYPPKKDVFSAMKSVDYNEVKVVIIGQDPYHGPGQANGMAFAVNTGVALPPSLVNIFKEIEAEYGAAPKGSTLTGWAKQGVLLLNTVLTVRESQPQSHSSFGWQQFTDAVIEMVNKRTSPVVFMLWGANAIAKKSLIDERHLVLTSVHPSPLSAYRGFFGCNHFKKANEFLESQGMNPINWLLVDDDGKADEYYGKGRIIRV